MFWEKQDPKTYVFRTSVSPCSGCETGHPSPRFALCWRQLLGPGRPACVSPRLPRWEAWRDHSHNGSTACRLRLHMSCASSGTSLPSTLRSYARGLRLPRTTRLALRTSLAGSDQINRLLAIPIINVVIKRHNNAIIFQCVNKIRSKTVSIG